MKRIKISQGIYSSGDARRKSLQTPLNVKGSRITHILGGAERGIKTPPEDPPRALMAIF